MTVVAVTGLNATDNPAPGVAVARALKERGDVRVVGLAYDLLDPGVYAPQWFDDVFLVPYPSQGTEALEARLRHIVEATGVEVVIPTLDSELPGFIALEPMLAELGVRMILPTREQLDLRAKTHLAELGRRAGLPVPEGAVINDPAELYTLHERIPYPMVVKGVFYGATVVHDLSGALAAYHSVLARWGGPVLVQAFVSGEEIDVCCVGDGKGGLLGAVPMKKTLLTDKGKGWAGVSIRDPEVLALAEAFMAATSWRGPCEVEVVRDRDGGYHLLEINPRFPAWCFMTVAAGCNLPSKVVDAALGLPVTPCEGHRAGTMFVRIAIDQIASLEDYEALATVGELRRTP
ncbi:MAG: ATP-grasp domain-containing protein [Alphaproteobacteria bacterium]|nr:ATP-grasp domain-containing protein [Alphaproteobacteria bacterium]